MKIDANYFDKFLEGKSLNRRNLRSISQVILDDISKKFSRELIKNDLIKKNILELDNKKLNLYFRKIAYDNSKYLVNFILYNRYLKKQKKKLIIYLEFNEFNAIFLKNICENFIEIKTKNRINYFLKNILKFFFIIFFSFINSLFQKFLIKKNPKPNVAFTFVEGLNIKTRNDVFWISSKLSKYPIVIFFNSKKDLHIFNKEIKNHFLYRFRTTKIKLYGVSRFNYRLKIKEQIQILKLFFVNIFKNNYLFIYLELILKTKYWTNYFIQNNIKIFYENLEGVSNFFRNFALDHVNGFAFSKERTLLSVTGPLDYYCSFSEDVKFFNNQISLTNFTKLINYSSINLISGYPYYSNHTYKLEDLMNSKDKSFSKIFIFFDSNHSDHLDLSEIAFIESGFVRKIYMILAELIEKYNIGLLIKSKKNKFSNFLFDDANFKNYLNKNIFIINKSFGIQPSSFKNCADFAISIGTNLPASLIEFLSYSNKNGLFVNYHQNIISNANLDLLKKNELILDNLDDLKKSLIKFINGDNGVGNWHKFKNDFFISQNDINGYQKISYFLENCLLNINKSKNEYLKIASGKYKNLF